jgi:hypothetical protein
MTPHCCMHALFNILLTVFERPRAPYVGRPRPRIALFG